MAAAEPSERCRFHDWTTRTRNVARRGTSGVDHALDSVAAHTTGAQPETQSKAGVLLGNSWRRQCGGHERRSDARDLFRCDAADNRDRVCERREPADRTRGRSSTGTRASPIARGITVASHPRTAGGRARAVGGGVVCGLPVCVVGLEGGYQVHHSTVARATHAARPDSGLDCRRVRIGAGAVVHDRGNARPGAVYREAAVAAFPEARRAKCRSNTDRDSRARSWFCSLPFPCCS